MQAMCERLQISILFIIYKLLGMFGMIQSAQRHTAQKHTTGS
jgi:hypothetical protein